MKRLLPIVCAVLVLTAACGDDKKEAPKTDTAAASAPASAAPASAAPSSSKKGTAGKLEFSTVGKMTGELFTKDPDCPFGQWDANSTGVDAKYRSSVASFKQFDCYMKKNESLPHRGQQAIFVEFKAANAAKAYAKDQASMYPTLIVGSTVVVGGTGLDKTDMKAWLQSVNETAGGAGEILA
ncbi:hypothetical protein ACQP00_12780 [Dactylosporangium sp. CS-047395]|uniref:hypothetical protein n=1 Tax=Dactylosporangium sp. CS-047395 TaxID=3239936 RepID=UPI003D936215